MLRSQIEFKVKKYAQLIGKNKIYACAIRNVLLIKKSENNRKYINEVLYTHMYIKVNM